MAQTGTDTSQTRSGRPEVQRGPLGNLSAPVATIMALLITIAIITAIAWGLSTAFAAMAG